MNFKKLLFKLWICILGIITAVLFVVIVGLLDEFILCAHAADTILTPQQSAALFGSSCTLQYYNSRTGISSDYTADLVGSTLQSNLWTFNGYESTGAIIPYNVRGDVDSNSYVIDTIYTSALIYRAYIPNYETDFLSSAPTDRVNLSFQLSLNLSGLSRFRTVVYPSVNYGTTSAAAGASGAFWQVSSSLGLLSGSPLINTTRGTYRYMWMYWGEAIYTPSNSALARTALACYDIDISGDDFSLSTVDIGVQHVRAISASYVYPDYGYQQEQGGYYYFLVQCPIIDGVLPETTLPPAYTTRSHDYSQYATTPANTIDLSNIEENQRIQIEIENDNRNYNAGTFDGVNIIIDQLNDIYSLMQARGEIAVDLLDAPRLPSDPSISRYVDDHLESFTTAQLPDETLTGGIGFIGKLVSWFSESFGWLWVLAALNLSLAVLSFAIFRSKGG